MKYNMEVLKTEDGLYFKKGLPNMSNNGIHPLLTEDINEAMLYYKFMSDNAIQRFKDRNNIILYKQEVSLEIKETE